MTDDIMERVADAIAEAVYMNQGSGHAWTLAARAAIEAMREPILDAISKVISSRDDLGQTHFNELRDAIDAVLHKDHIT